MSEQLDSALETIKQEDLSAWASLDDWRLQLLLLLVFLIILLWLGGKLRRAIRRRRPATINPKLQKYGRDYGQPDKQLLVKRRAEAERIVATSSTNAIVGYDITEQVEAVFVDGFRRPEEAMEGLKAVAAMKGANAVTNVRHERSASDKCSAHGDAVIVHRLGNSAPQSAAAPTVPTDAPLIQKPDQLQWPR